MSGQLNPQIQLFLLQFNELMKNMPKEIPVEQGRWAYEQFAMIHSGVPLRMACIEDIDYKSKDGASIPLRVYLPKLGANLPALVYYHGGGWQRGSINSHDSICRNIALKAGIAVISVEWRLAPEHKFPTGPNDCLEVWEWFSREGYKAYNIDGARIAMGGDSAGGNMTAVTTQRLKALGKQLPCFQLLFYPSVDLSCSMPSYKEFEDGYFLSSERVQYYVNHYLNDSSEIDNPMASPLRNTDFSGLPPAHIVTSEFDPLRDEGHAYYEKLKAAGVDATYECAEGMIHAFLHMTHTVPAVNDVFDRVANRLKEGLTL